MCVVIIVIVITIIIIIFTFAKLSALEFPSSASERGEALTWQHSLLWHRMTAWSTVLSSEDVPRDEVGLRMPAGGSLRQPA